MVINPQESGDHQRLGQRPRGLFLYDVNCDHMAVKFLAGLQNGMDDGLIFLFCGYRPWAVYLVSMLAMISYCQASGKRSWLYWPLLFLLLSPNHFHSDISVLPFCSVLELIPFSNFASFSCPFNT